MVNAFTPITLKKRMNRTSAGIDTMSIADLSYHVLHVSAKTNWSFVRVRMDNGLTGWGECSLNGWETLQRAFADTWWPALTGRNVNEVADVAALCTIHLHGR